MPYEFDAKRYERSSSHQQDWGQRLIGELHLTGSERILDLGCGDGRLTAQLAERVSQGHVLGIDVSRNMIDQPSLVPFLAHLKGPDRQRFRDIVVDRMIERTSQADGTFLEAFRRINVRARKV